MPTHTAAQQGDRMMEGFDGLPLIFFSLGRHPIERAYRAAGAIVISGGMVYGAGQGPIMHVYASAIVAAKQNNTVAKLPSVFGDG